MENHTDTVHIICGNIAKMRKQQGMTQEQLAEKLGVSFQAVSKWENEQACPDVTLLPCLAEIFHISLDTLFGRESFQLDTVKKKILYDLPWPDDGMIRGVVYLGRTLLEHPIRENEKLSIEYLGDLKDISCNMNLTCQDVAGDVQVGANISCGDVQGFVKAGATVNCSDVNGSVEAGSSVKCGNVGQNVRSGATVTCQNVGGDVTAVGKVDCGNVTGSVKAAVVHRG